MLRALLAASLLGLLFAAPAQAGARADAKRLVRVYVAYERAVERHTEDRMRELERETETCPAQPPESAVAEQVSRDISLYIRNFIALADGHLARLERRMRGFDTRDRALRRLSRAMGGTTGLIRVLGEAPPQPCPYLEAWKAAGWAEDFRISPPVRNLTAAEVARLQRDARAVRRALPRLRRLGVSAARVESLRDSWTGEELFSRLDL